MTQVYELTIVDDEVVAAFERLIPQLTAVTPPTKKDLWQMVSSESCRLFMARAADGQIAGSAALGLYRTPTGLHAWIEDVVVGHAYRRQGIGEALSRAAIEAAKEMDENGDGEVSQEEMEKWNDKNLSLSCFFK